MPITKRLSELLAEPLDAATRQLAESLRQAQTELDRLRHANTDPAQVERRRLEMLLEAQRRIERWYATHMEGPRARMRSIEREYESGPTGKLAEMHRIRLERFIDDLTLMSDRDLALLAEQVASGAATEAQTRAHKAAVVRECRCRCDQVHADAISATSPYEPERWKSDSRWEQAAAELKRVEELAGDSRVLNITHADGSVKAYRLDELVA